MMKKLTLVLIVVVLTYSAKAQFFNDLVNAVGSVVNTGIQVATAPTQAIINTAKVITGTGSISNIYQPYQQVATNAGSALPQVVGVINQPQNFLMSKAEEFASSVAGRPR